MTRAAQRNALLAERRAISAQQRKQWDAQIAEQVVEWCKAHSVKMAGIYSPIQAEPSLHEIFPLLKDLGVEFALPSALEKDSALTFLSFSPGDELMKDRYGVLVPLETARVVVPDVLFIPCVGFTKDGYRLGYGGGFYDRTLASKLKPKAVGIAYRLSLCELDLMPHDVAMDSIITDYS